MWTQFLFENAYFAIHLFAALTFFAVFWLYFDAWKEKKQMHDGVRLLGFLLLSVSFLLKSTFLESSILENSMLGGAQTTTAYLILRNVGYLLLIVGALADKLQPRPKDSPASNIILVLPVVTLTFSIFQVLPSVMALVIAILYFIKARVGLEAHVKPVALSFFILAIAETLGLATLFRVSQHVSVFNVVAPFGPIWILENSILLLSSIVLARWVFGYLLKQFEPQLFMILSFLTLVIFLTTTIAFTGLLLKNIQSEALTRLGSDVKVLRYALDSKRTESVSDAEVIAQNPVIVAALKNNDRQTLSTLSEQFLLSKKETTLIVVNSDGQVVARGEDREKTGDSLSSDRLVSRALNGESSSTAVSKDGVLSPTLSIRGAAPIKDNEKVIGAVMLGTNIDNAFVTGIKKATGLEASLYGDTILSATTLLALDGKSPLIGIKEENPEVKKNVLQESKNYESGVSIGGTLYFASYLPFLDVDNNPIGMLFVGRPQITVLQAASKSIEMTFVVTAVLLLFSIIPSYLISRYISKQLD